MKSWLLSAINSSFLVPVY